MFFISCFVGVEDLQPVSLLLGCTCNTQVFSREMSLYEVEYLAVQEMIFGTRCLNA